MLRAKALPVSKLSYSASQFCLEAAAKYLSMNKTKGDDGCALKARH